MKGLSIASLALATGCAAGPTDPVGGGVGGGKGDELGEPAEPATWASCFIEPGVGDRFFNPDAVVCSFDKSVFGGQRGTVSIRGSHACGTFEKAFFSDDITGEPNAIANFVLAHNSCPGGVIPEDAYPVTLEINWSGTPLNPLGKKLVWDTAMESAAAATVENPLTARSSIVPWTIEIDNQLIDTRFALVGMDDTTLPLGPDLVARPQNLSDAAPDESEIVMTFRSVAFRAGEEGHTLQTYVSSSVSATPELTMNVRNEITRFDITGPGSYVLTDSGIAREDDTSAP